MLICECCWTVGERIVGKGKLQCYSVQSSILLRNIIEASNRKRIEPTAAAAASAEAVDLDV